MGLGPDNFSDVAGLWTVGVISSLPVSGLGMIYYKEMVSQTLEAW